MCPASPRQDRRQFFPLSLSVISFLFFCSTVSFVSLAFLPLVLTQSCTHSASCVLLLWTLISCFLPFPSARPLPHDSLFLRDFLLDFSVSLFPLLVTLCLLRFQSLMNPLPLCSLTRSPSLLRYFCFFHPTASQTYLSFLLSQLAGQPVAPRKYWTAQDYFQEQQEVPRSFLRCLTQPALLKTTETTQQTQTKARERREKEQEKLRFRKAVYAYNRLLHFVEQHTFKIMCTDEFQHSGINRSFV